jgi:peptide/nickel transport system substrate-binding protein
VFRHGMARSLLIFGLVVAGCTPSATTERTPGRSTSSVTTKLLAIGLDEDLRNLWNVATEGAAGSEAQHLLHAIHQPLAANTSDGSPVPRVFQELPSVERGTWKVFDDGTMATTWRLRAGATWQDGAPFTARDVLFSFDVFRDPEIPNSFNEVVKRIQAMEEVDSSTVLVRWGDTYPYADRIETKELFLLPAHLLADTYAEAKSRLPTLSYFSTSDFVGLGPFRVTAWEAGSHLDLEANAAYFHGAPKIDRVRVTFIPDGNTMLANLKSGAIQMVLGAKRLDRDAMRFLEHDWEASGAGRVLVFPRNYKFAEPQKLLNPLPADLADPLVRRALLEGLDRAELARAVYQERGVVADSWVHPTFERFALVQDAVARYAYEPRRAEARLEEAGWRRGGDALLQKDGQRFLMTIRDVDGDEKLPLMTADYWKALGISASYEYQSRAQMQDRQARATYTGLLFTNNGIDLKSVVRRIGSDNIPTPENRWTGTNRGGYASAAWDALGDRLLTTLDERYRIDVERQMLQLYTSELPLLPLFYTLDELPLAAGISGPKGNTGVPANSTILYSWNIHEWDVSAPS